MKNKNLKILPLVGGILMIVISFIVIFMEGGRLSVYMMMIGGLSFTILGINGMKAKPQEDLSSEKLDTENINTVE